MPVDFEINGRIFWQLREILGDNFFLIGFRDEETKEKFSNVVLDVMLKLHSMRYHVDNFKQIEEQYLKSIETSEQGIFRTHRMLFEFEAFLFQLKSTLDITVKVLSVFLPNRFPTKTFRGKGVALCASLEKYKHDKTCKTDLADNLIGVICDDREAWLEHAISLRDDIGHYRTLAEFNYHAVNHGTTRKITKPQIAGMPPLEYMQLTFQNCIEFVQDFLCIAVALAIPSQFGLSGANPNIGEPIAQYIKYGLGIRSAA
ncbi:MAG: hypothetical protein A2W72_02440 [Burkholderiales bacterium RIFCSPLOWO2_12_67_14]|nr:MAG: hypothetical protein A3I64_20260 [Burkholderiales bacterium RIFCSPLOWO2_02_FULL_67_64]OGB35846.1 MAG: hypothetical protein A3E51_06305 [Burkholderiales bacterium RIFCSPHIGHO2_12_FULL_67_38]OGB38522.1 MAG: hypothetical protein A2W72_02440 [Burkholderiales bacterium RIFCSPLOWO2_12_67_14]OGB76142.1 MAG: hypothetical protein A3G82_19725 [Burkholderiales bacterium RIFCSPLOWO2_12_FULL_67_210]